MLKKEIDITIWSKHLTVYENDNVDRSELSLFMERNITNALLAVYLDNYGTAEIIVKNIKSSAEALNIKSSSIEALVLKLKDDLSIEDDVLRAKIVKQTINLLEEAIILTLDSMGSDADITYLEFGVWLEAVLITSRLVTENYSKSISSILNRSVEVEYFIDRFKVINDDISDLLKKNKSTFEANENHFIEKSQILNFLESVNSIELLETGVN